MPTRPSFAAIVLALFAAKAAIAQDVDNGRRILERSCASCHLINAPAGRVTRVIAFSAIAAKPGMTAETIATFLQMPQMSMPGLPLTPDNAQDVAAFIMSLGKQQPGKTKTR